MPLKEIIHSEFSTYELPKDAPVGTVDINGVPLSLASATKEIGRLHAENGHQDNGLALFYAGLGGSPTPVEETPAGDSPNEDGDVNTKTEETLPAGTELPIAELSSGQLEPTPESGADTTANGDATEQENDSNPTNPLLD